MSQDTPEPSKSFLFGGVWGEGMKDNKQTVANNMLSAITEEDKRRAEVLKARSSDPIWGKKVRHTVKGEDLLIKADQVLLVRSYNKH